jgi:hypothetical protein
MHTALSWAVSIAKYTMRTAPSNEDCRAHDSNMTLMHTLATTRSQTRMVERYCMGVVLRVVAATVRIVVLAG